MADTRLSRDRAPAVVPAAIAAFALLLNAARALKGGTWVATSYGNADPYVWVSQAQSLSPGPPPAPAAAFPDRVTYEMLTKDHWPTGLPVGLVAVAALGGLDPVDAYEAFAAAISALLALGVFGIARGYLHWRIRLSAVAGTARPTWLIIRCSTRWRRTRSRRSITAAPCGAALEACCTDSLADRSDEGEREPGEDAIPYPSASFVARSDPVDGDDAFFVYPPFALAILPLAVLPFPLAAALWTALLIGCVSGTLPVLDVSATDWSWRLFRFSSLRLGALTPVLMVLAALAWRYRDDPLRARAGLQAQSFSSSSSGRRSFGCS